MKIKPGFRLHQMFGKNTIVAEGAQQINFNKIIALNDSAAVMWLSAEGREFDISDMARALIDRYGIDNQIATLCAERMCRQWIETGLVEP